MTALHNALTDPALNVGVALRWTCALTEMEEFNKHQAQYLSKMASWVTGVRNAVSDYAPYLGSTPPFSPHQCVSIWDKLARAKVVLS